MNTKFETILKYLRNNEYAKVELIDHTITLIKHYDSEDGMFLTEKGESLYLDEILYVY